MLAKATSDQLQKLEGIGPNIAMAITDWFSRSKNREILAKLKSYGLWPIEQEKVPKSIAQTLAGMTFVVTGTLEGFSRDEVKDYIESYGGKVIESVSKSTTYLVLGENPGSKLEKARSLNIRIISEQELRDIAERT